MAATASAGLTGNAFAAGSGIRQRDLLNFDSTGQVTLLNFTDIHAQLLPLYYREPSVNLGVGEVQGLPPHLTGEAMLNHFGLRPGTLDAYMFTGMDFQRLAAEYGRIGGLAYMATLIKAIRAERPGQTLLIDNGDTWQGSYTSLHSRGADMVEAMNALGVDAMTGHWEFTYGQERVQELIEQLQFPFLAGNVVDNDWGEAIFESTAFFERGGLNIAVIGQAFPYTPVANPRHMIPEWSFGIREETIAENVRQARAAGADLVVVASHNGFDVDRKLASRVDGIDVLLTGHTHDAIPAAVKVKDTLLVAAGSHGKFLARLDLDVRDRKVADYRFRLIPVLADVISPDAEMAALIERLRAPHKDFLNTELGRTDSTLYRRGNFNGTFDDLILDAIRSERDTEIALSPGFRWGSSLLAGQAIRMEDVYNQTAITYPACYRSEMTGATLKEILEDVADNLFNPDPYYQQGGDMVRVGGMSYRIDIRRPIGKRISDMRLTDSGAPIDPGRKYTVGGWASVNPETSGPPIYEVVAEYLRGKQHISLQPNRNIKIAGA
jgi:sulfur-oxidizing protein SoxB